MLITKIICDKCKKEITESTAFQGKDLCQCCTDKAVRMILAWIEKEDDTVPDQEKPKKEIKKIEKKEPVKEKKEEPKKIKPVVQIETKIDWDKACALKIAGWKNEAIADELKVGLSTINSGTFYKKITQYKIERGIK